MKRAFLLAFLFLLLAPFVKAQTVSGITTSVTVSGSGFAVGNVVTAQPSNTVCTNVVVVSASLMTADCPNGTMSVTVTSNSGGNGSYLLSPTSLSFSWTIGTTPPVSQTLQQLWTGCIGCPAAMSTTSSWLKISGPSWGGTNADPILSYPISVITTNMTAGTYQGTIAGASNGGKPATFSIPVTFTVTNSATVHKATLTWTGSPSATGYNVLRASVSGGPYTVVNSTPVTTTTYADTTVKTKQTYYYVVQAVLNSCPKCTSPNSNQASVAIP